MALTATFNDNKFNVGDVVKVIQNIQEGEKTRKQAFQGMVIGIKGRGENKTFTIRRVGSQNVGIERIFPLESPSISDIEVVRKGKRGIRRAKLYYTRDKSRKMIEKIYSRSVRREETKPGKAS